MKLNILLLQFCISAIGISQTALITSGNQWKYYDQGNNLPANWNSLSYNDAAWSDGNTEVGYGDGDENTSVGYGPDGNNKYITTYFRKTIVVTNQSQFSHLDLSVLRDD